MAKKAETYEAMAERLQSIADKLADGNLPLEACRKMPRNAGRLQGAAGRDRKTKRGERR